MPADSDVFFVRGSLQLLDSEGVMNPTIQKTLWAANAATITADRNYWIVSVTGLTTGAWVLSETNETTATVGSANSKVTDVIAAISATTWLPSQILMRYFWKSGKKLFLNSSGGLGVLFVLELAQ